MDEILGSDAIAKYLCIAKYDQIYVCQSGHLDRYALQFYAKRARYCIKIGCDQRAYALNKALIKAVYMRGMRGRSIATEALHL